MWIEEDENEKRNSRVGAGSYCLCFVWLPQLMEYSELDASARVAAWV